MQFIMNHYKLDPLPSQLVSEETPVLEWFNFTADGSQNELHLACDDLVAAIAQSGRQSSYSVSVEDSQTVLFVVAWKSVEEHESEKAKKHFQEAMAKFRDLKVTKKSMVHVKLTKA